TLFHVKDGTKNHNYFMVFSAINLNIVLYISFCTFSLILKSSLSSINYLMKLVRLFAFFITFPYDFWGAHWPISGH
ncbi:hypothetical protein EVC98_22270, partial [Salmonella enterica]|nr:hypothetical protein [Salmonella enterica]